MSTSCLKILCLYVESISRIKSYETYVSFNKYLLRTYNMPDSVLDADTSKAMSPCWN